MTQEDKNLLLKDLCARLPYGVKIKYLPDDRLDGIVLPYLHNGLTVLQKGAISYRAHIKDIRPYLRSTLNMTEEELYIIKSNWAQLKEGNWLYESVDEITTLLNSHHFDYRGLIEKGLALEAPEGMYKVG